MTHELVSRVSAIVTRLFKHDKTPDPALCKTKRPIHYNIHRMFNATVYIDFAPNDLCKTPSGKITGKS